MRNTRVYPRTMFCGDNQPCIGCGKVREYLHACPVLDAVVVKTYKHTPKDGRMVEAFRAGLEAAEDRAHEQQKQGG